MTIQELKEQIEDLNADLQKNIVNLDNYQTEESVTKAKINKSIVNIQKDILRLRISTQMLFNELPMDKLSDMKKQQAKEKLFGGRSLWH